MSADALKLKYALLLVEFTSIPLLILGLAYLITGYQLLVPGIQMVPYARLIHGDKALRVTLVAFSTLHGYAGLLILLHRRVKGKLLRSALEVSVNVVTLLLVATFIYLELLVK